MGVPVARVPEFEEKFLGFLEREYQELLPSIKEKREMSEEAENELKSSLEKFKTTHADLFIA